MSNYTPIATRAAANAATWEDVHEDLDSAIQANAVNIATNRTRINTNIYAIQANVDDIALISQADGAVVATVQSNATISSDVSTSLSGGCFVEQRWHIRGKCDDCQRAS